MKLLFTFLGLFIFYVQISIAQNPVYRSVFKNVNKFNRIGYDAMDEPYLKAHLASGGLCIFTDTIWEYNEESDIISGNARLYDSRRNLISTGVIKMKSDSIVLFETKRKQNMQGRNRRLATRTIT